MKYSISVGKVSGIRIFIHWTFFLLIGWIIYTNLKANVAAVQILWSLGLVLSVFVCITLHELGHALMAKRFRIKTRHITLLPFGGVAQLESIPDKPDQELKVAFAGPAVNILIALFILPFAGLSAFNREASAFNEITSQNFLPLVMAINIWLAIFNLIPAFPMDGGRIFRALLAFRMDFVKATNVAATVGKLLAVAFVFVGLLYNPVLLFIGMFVFLGAEAENKSVVSRFILKNYTLQNALMPEIPVIDKTSTVRYAMDKLLAAQNKNFMIKDGDQWVGILTRDEIIAASQDPGASAKILDLKLRDVTFLPVTTPLDVALSEMVKQKKPMILVTEKSNVIGMVDEDNLAEFILLHARERKQHNVTVTT